MKHLGTVRLETPRLILRPFVLADAQAMFDNWASDPQVTRYLSWQPHENVEASRELLKIWVNSYVFLDFYNWAIEVKEGPLLIGSIGGVDYKDSTRAISIGYCIGQAWWHQGYVSEALKRLLAFFFDQVGLNRIQACHEPANIHSGQVMEKCGMRYEGLMRQTIAKPEGLADGAYYAILAGDWKKV